MENREQIENTRTISYENVFSCLFRVEYALATV